MRIYFDARYDLEDVSHGSGSYHFLIRHLRAHGAEVITGAPTHVRKPFSSRALDAYFRSVRGMQYHYFLERSYARRLGQTVCARLRRDNFDVLFTNDRNVAAYYHAHQPVVLVTDNIFRATVRAGWYERYQRLCPRNLRDGDSVQELALQHAMHTFVPSQWVYEHAIQMHGGDPKAVHFVRWGANLHDIPDRDACNLRDVPGRSRCNLLSIGLDWRRKQGDLIVATWEVLRGRGIGAKLTIVGMSSPEGVPAGVTIVAHLSKARLADRELLARLYSESHFFVLPTRAEGYGIVFVEAAAHALPSLGFRLTGVVSSVLDGVSGTLLEPGANAEQFADVIEHYLSRPAEYQRLCRSARNFYETEANWPRASREMLDIVGRSLRKRERKVEAAS